MKIVLVISYGNNTKRLAGLSRYITRIFTHAPLNHAGRFAIWSRGALKEDA
jgi:hypothetical protein